MTGLLRAKMEPGLDAAALAAAARAVGEAFMAALGWKYDDVMGAGRACRKRAGAVKVDATSAPFYEESRLVTPAAPLPGALSVIGMRKRRRHHRDGKRAQRVVETVPPPDEGLAALSARPFPPSFDHKHLTGWLITDLER